MIKHLANNTDYQKGVISVCTAISVTVDDNYFGRNLDFELSFGEKVIIMTKNFELSFRNGKTIKNHFALTDDLSFPTLFLWTV